MTIKKTNILIVIFIGYIAQSCITYKADSKSVSAPDYNQRVEVKGTHFDGVLNPLGVSSIVVTTAGGAYAGYQSNLIQYNDGGKQTTSKVTNAILGAAVGFGTSYFLNRWCGWGKVKSTYEVNKDWIKSANKNFRLISGNHENITIIPSSADNNFVFRNIQDAKDYSTVFPSSPYTDKAFSTGIINLTRTDLPTLIALYPNTKSNSLAQIKYIQTAPTYSQIKDAVYNYPNTTEDYEKYFLKLATTYNDAADFKKRFPSSSNFNTLIVDITPKLARVELPNLIELFNTQSSIETAKIEYIRKSNDIDEFFQAIKKYPLSNINVSEISYYDNIESVSKTYSDLYALRTILNWENFIRISKSLNERYINTKLQQANTENDCNSLLSDLTNNDWLANLKTTYSDIIYKKIQTIREANESKERNRLYDIAYSKGIEAIIEFAKLYHGTPEANKADDYIQYFVNNNIEISREPFTHVAKGNRGFWTTWAESMRDVVKGGENYNIFILGCLKNKSNLTVPLKLKVTLHLVINRRLSILGSSTTNVDKEEYFYMNLAPNEENPFACIYPDISGGTTVGTSLLLSKSSNTQLAKDPISIEFEYNHQNVSAQTYKEQRSLLKNLVTKGNVDVKDWGGGSAVADFIGNINGDGERCALNIVYSSESDNPEMEVYDTNDNLVDSKKWDSSGRNITTFYLKKGRYKIEVNDCDGKFNVNVNTKSMSFIIKDCKSSSYRENE